MAEGIKTKRKCDPRCWRAKSKTCRCACAGDNHGCENQPSLFTGTRPQNQNAIHPKYRQEETEPEAPAMEQEG